MLIKFVLFTFGAPVVAGAVAATALTFGVVQWQTGAPSQNPASNSVISYGARS